MSRIPGFGSLGGAPNFAEFARNNSSSAANSHPPSAISSRRNSLSAANNPHHVSGTATPEPHHHGTGTATPQRNNHIGIPGLSSTSSVSGGAGGLGGGHRVSTSLSNASLIHHDHSAVNNNTNMSMTNINNTNNQNQLGSNDIMRAQAWAVTTKLGPGRSSKVWIVMRPGRLSLYSSPSGHSRLLLDVQYETLRTLFFFSCPGSHAHVDERTQQALRAAGSGIDHHHHQRSRSGTGSSAPNSRASSSSNRAGPNDDSSSTSGKGLCLHYFGFDLLKAPSASDGRRRRQRFIFATDRHNDVEQWKRFLLAVEDSLLPSSQSNNLPPAHARFRFFDDSEIGTERGIGENYHHNHLDDYFDELDDHQQQQSHQNRSRSGSTAAVGIGSVRPPQQQQYEQQIQQLEEELEKAKNTAKSWKDAATNLWTQVNDMVLGLGNPSSSSSAVSPARNNNMITDPLSSFVESDSTTTTVSPTTVLSSTLKPSSSSISPQAARPFSSNQQGETQQQEEGEEEYDDDHQHETSLLTNFKKHQTSLLGRLRELLVSTTSTSLNTAATAVDEIAPTFFVEAASSVVETLREKSTAMLSLMSELSVSNIREKQHDFALVAAQYSHVEEASKKVIENYSSLCRVKGVSSASASPSPSSSPLSARRQSASLESSPSSSLTSKMVAARLERIAKELAEEREELIQNTKERKQQQQQSSPNATPIRHEQEEHEEKQKMTPSVRAASASKSPQQQQQKLDFSQIFDASATLLLSVQSLVPTFVYHSSLKANESNLKSLGDDLSRASLSLSSYVASLSSSSTSSKSPSGNNNNANTPSRAENITSTSTDDKALSPLASIIDIETTMNRLVDTQAALARREEDLARVELQVRTLTSQNVELLKLKMELEKEKAKEDASTHPMTPAPATKTRDQALSPVSPVTSGPSSSVNSSSSRHLQEDQLEQQVQDETKPNTNNEIDTNIKEESQEEKTEKDDDDSPPRGSALESSISPKQQHQTSSKSSPRARTGENDQEIASVVRDSLTQALSRGFVFNTDSTTCERIRVLMLKLFDYSVSLPRIEDLKALKEMEHQARIRIEVLEKEISTLKTDDEQQQQVKSDDDNNNESNSSPVGVAASTPINKQQKEQETEMTPSAPVSDQHQHQDQDQFELFETLASLQQSAIALLQRLQIDTSPSEKDAKQLALLLDGVTQATVVSKTVSSDDHQVQMSPIQQQRESSQSNSPSSKSPSSPTTNSNNHLVVRFLHQQIASLRRSESAFEEIPQTQWDESWSDIVLSFYEDLRTKLESQIDSSNEQRTELEKRISALEENDHERTRELEEKTSELEHLRLSIRQLETLRSLSPASTHDGHHSPSSQQQQQQQQVQTSPMMGATINSSTSPMMESTIASSTHATVNTSPPRSEYVATITTTTSTTSATTMTSPTPTTDSASSPTRQLLTSSTGTITSPSHSSSQQITSSSIGTIMTPPPTNTSASQETQYSPAVSSPETNNNNNNNTVVSNQIRSLRRNYDGIVALVAQLVTTKERFDEQHRERHQDTNNNHLINERGNEADYQDSVDPLVFEQEEIQHLTQQLSRLVEWCYEKPIKMCGSPSSSNQTREEETENASSSPTPIQCVIICIEALFELLDKSSSFIIAPTTSASSSTTLLPLSSDITSHTRHIADLLKDWAKSNRQVDIHLQETTATEDEDGDHHHHQRQTLNEKLSTILSSLKYSSDTTMPSYEKLLSGSDGKESSSTTAELPLDSVETAYNLQRIVNTLREISPSSSLSTVVQDVRKTVTALRELTLAARNVGKRCIAESTRYQEQEQQQEEEEEEEETNSNNNNILDISSTESLLNQVIFFSTELSRTRRDLAALLDQQQLDATTTTRETQELEQQIRDLKRDCEVLSEASNDVLKKLNNTSNNTNDEKKQSSTPEETARNLQSAVDSLIKKDQEKTEEVKRIAEIVASSDGDDENNNHHSNDSSSSVESSCKKLKDKNHQLNQQVKTLKQQIDSLVEKERERESTLKSESKNIQEESQKSARDVKLLSDSAARCIKMMRPDHDRQPLSAEDLALSLEATTQNTLDKHKRGEKAFSQLAKELSETSPLLVTSPQKSSSSSSSTVSPDIIVDSCKDLVSRYSKQQKRLDKLEKELEEKDSSSNSKSQELETKLKESEDKSKLICEERDLLRKAIKDVIGSSSKNETTPQELAKNLQSAVTSQQQKIKQFEKALSKCASALAEEEQEEVSSDAYVEKVVESVQKASADNKKMQKEITSLKEQLGKKEAESSQQLKQLQEKTSSNDDKITELETENGKLNKTIQEVEKVLLSEDSASSLSDNIKSIVTDLSKYKKIVGECCDILNVSSQDYDLPITCKKLLSDKSLLEEKLARKEEEIEDFNHRLGRLRKDEELTAEEAAARKKRALSTEDELRFQLSEERSKHEEQLRSMNLDKNILRDSILTSINKLDHEFGRLHHSKTKKEDDADVLDSLKNKDSSAEDLAAALESSAANAVDQGYANSNAMKRIGAATSSSSSSSTVLSPSDILNNVETLVTQTKKKDDKIQELENKVEDLKQRHEKEVEKIKESTTATTSSATTAEEKLQEAQSRQQLLEKEKQEQSAQNSNNKLLIDTLQSSNEKLQKQLDSEHELIVENLRRIISLLRSSAEETSNLILSRSIDGLLVTLETVAQHHNADFVRVKSALKRIANVVANAEVSAQELFVAGHTSKRHHRRHPSSVSQENIDEQNINTAFDPSTATPESTVAETETVLSRFENALQEEKTARSERVQHEKELLRRLSDLERHVSVVTEDRECLVNAMKSIAESISSSSSSKPSSALAENLQRILRQIQSHSSQSQSQSQLSSHRREEELSTTNSAVGTRKPSPNPLPPSDDAKNTNTVEAAVEVSSNSEEEESSSSTSTKEPSSSSTSLPPPTGNYNTMTKHSSSQVQALADATANAVAELAEKERTINQSHENIERLIVDQHIPGVDVSSMEATITSLLNEINRTRRLVETGSPDHTRQQMHLLRTADECLRALLDTGKINIPLPPTTDIRDREAPQVVANALRSATEQVLPMIEQYVYQSRPGSRIVSPSRGLSPYTSPGGSPNKSMPLSGGRPPRGPIVSESINNSPASVTRRLAAQHEEEKQQLTQELTQSKAENEKLLENVSDLEQQCSKVDEAMTQLRGTLDEITNDREKSREEVAQVQKENDELQQEITQKNGELNDIKEQLQELNSVLKRTDSENELLRQNLEKTNVDLQDTQTDLEKTKGELGELKDIKTQIDDQIERLAKQRETLTHNLKKAEEKIEDLESSLEEETSAKNELEENLNDANTKIEKLTTHLTERKKEIVELEKELEESRSESDQLRLKLEKSNNKIDHLASELKESQQLAATNEENSNILQGHLHIASLNSFSFPASALKLSSDCLEEFASQITQENSLTIDQYKNEVSRLTKERDGLVKEKKILSEATRRVISELDPLHRKFIQRSLKMKREREGDTTEHDDNDNDGNDNNDDDENNQQQKQKQASTTILDEIEEDEHDEQVQRERSAQLEEIFSKASSSDLAQMAIETSRNVKSVNKQDTDRLQKIETSVDKLATGSLVGSDGSVDSFGTSAEAQIDRLKTTLKVLHERSRSYDLADEELKVMTNQREALVEAARSAIFSLDGNKRRVVAIQHENDGFIVAKALKAAAKDASDVRRAKQAHIDHLRSLLLEVVPHAAVANEKSPVRSPGKHTSIPDPQEQLNVEDDVTPLVDAVVAEVRKQRTQLRTLEQQSRSASIKSEGESHSTRSAILECAATLSSSIGKTPEEVVREEEKATKDTQAAVGILKNAVSATLEQLRKYHRDAALYKQKSLQSQQIVNEIRESLSPVLISSSSSSSTPSSPTKQQQQQQQQHQGDMSNDNDNTTRTSSDEVQLETCVATLVTELERLRKVEAERNRELPLYQRANADRKLLMMSIRDIVPMSFSSMVNTSNTTALSSSTTTRQSSPENTTSRSLSPQARRQTSQDDEVFNVSEASSTDRRTTTPTTANNNNINNQSQSQQQQQHQSPREYPDAKSASNELLEYINHLQSNFRDRDKSINIERQLAQNKIATLEQELETLHRTSQQLLGSIRSSAARVPPPFSAATSQPGSRKSSPLKQRAKSALSSANTSRAGSPVKQKSVNFGGDGDHEYENNNNPLQQLQQHHQETSSTSATAADIQAVTDDLAAALVEASGTFERENSRKEKNLKQLSQIFSLDQPQQLEKKSTGKKIKKTKKGSSSSRKTKKKNNESLRQQADDDDGDVQVSDEEYEEEEEHHLDDGTYVFDEVSDEEEGDDEQENDNPPAVDLDSIVLAAKRTMAEHKIEKEGLTALLNRAHEAAALLFASYIEVLEQVVSDLPRLASKADDQSNTLEQLQNNLQTAKFVAGENVSIEELCEAVVEELKEVKQLNRELEAEAISANKRAQADSAQLIASVRAGLVALSQARKLQNQQQTEQQQLANNSSPPSSPTSKRHVSPGGRSQTGGASTASSTTMFEQYDISMLPTALTRTCRDVADDLGTAETALQRIAETLAIQQQKELDAASSPRASASKTIIKPLTDPHQIALQCEERLGNANSAIGDRNMLLDSIRDAVGKLEFSAAQSPAGSPLLAASLTPARRGIAQKQPQFADDDFNSSVSPQTPPRGGGGGGAQHQQHHHHYDTTLVLSKLSKCVNATTEREEMAAAELAAVTDAVQRAHLSSSYDSSSAASSASALVDALLESRSLCSASEERAKHLGNLVSSVARALRDLRTDELPSEQELAKHNVPASQTMLVLSANAAVEKLVHSEKSMKNILSTMKMQSFGENWEKPVVERLVELEEQSKTLTALQNSFNQQKAKLCRFVKIAEDEKNWADQIEEIIIQVRIENERIKRSTAAEADAYHNAMNEKDRVCQALNVDPQSVWFEGVAQKFRDVEEERNELDRKLREASRQRDSLLQTIVGGTSRSYVDDATIDQATKRVIEERQKLNASLDTNRAWLDSLGELIRAMNLNHPGEDKLPAQITNPCRIHYADVAATAENLKREKAAMDVALRQLNDSNGNMKEEINAVCNNISPVLNDALETYFYTKENPIELSKFVNDEVSRLRSQFNDLGQILVKVQKEKEEDALEEQESKNDTNSNDADDESTTKNTSVVSVPQSIHSCHLVVHELREKRALAKNALENVAKFKSAMDSVGDACSIPSIALTPAEHSAALVKQIEEWREDVKQHRLDVEALSNLREEHEKLLEEFSRIKELLGPLREASSQVTAGNASSPWGFTGTVSEHTINSHGHQTFGGGGTSSNHASPAPGGHHHNQQHAAAAATTGGLTTTSGGLQRTGSGIPPPSPAPSNLPSHNVLAASARRRQSKAKLKALDHTESEVVAVTYGDSLRVAESPTRDSGSNVKFESGASFESSAGANDKTDDDPKTPTKQISNNNKNQHQQLPPPASGSPPVSKFDKKESQVGLLQDVITQLKDTKQTNSELNNKIDELDLQVSTLRDQLHTVRRENVQLQANLKDRELDIQALESALGEANKRIELLDNALADRNYNLEQANQILQISGVPMVIAHAPHVVPSGTLHQHQQQQRTVSPSPLMSGTDRNNNNNNIIPLGATSDDEEGRRTDEDNDEENEHEQQGTNNNNNDIRTATVYPSPRAHSTVTNSPSLTESYAAQLGPLIPSTVPENIKRVVEALEAERITNKNFTALVEDSSRALHDVEIFAAESGGHLETCRLAADTIVGLRQMLQQTQAQLEGVTEELNREREIATTHATAAFNSIIQMMKEEFRERDGLIEKYTEDPLPSVISELTKVLADLAAELPPLAKKEIAGDHERMFLREQLDKAATDRWRDKDAYEDNQQYLAGCLRDIASEAELELPWSIAEPWPVERFVQVVDMIKEAVRMKNSLAHSAAGGGSAISMKQELESMRAAVMDICVICGIDSSSPSGLTVAVESVRLTRANIERMMIAHNNPVNDRKWDLAEMGSMCRRLVEVGASQNSLLLNACNKLSRLSVGRCTITVPTLDKDSEAPVLREWANSMETIVVSANPGGMSALRASLIDVMLRAAPPEVLQVIGLPTNALTPPGGLEGFTDNSIVECISELLGRALRFAKNAADEIFTLKSKFGAERLAVKERFGPMIRALRMKLDADRRSTQELRECDIRLGELEKHLTTAALTAMTSSSDRKKEVSDMIGHMRNLVRRKIASDAEAEHQFTSVYNSAGDPSLMTGVAANVNNNLQNQQHGYQHQQQYAAAAPDENSNYNNPRNNNNNNNNTSAMTLPRW